MDPEFLARLANLRRQTDGTSSTNSTPQGSLFLLGSSASVMSPDFSDSFSIVSLPLVVEFPPTPVFVDQTPPGLRNPELLSLVQTSEASTARNSYPLQDSHTVIATGYGDNTHEEVGSTFTTSTQRQQLMKLPASNRSVSHNSIHHIPPRQTQISTQTTPPSNITQQPSTLTSASSTSPNPRPSLNQSSNKQGQPAEEDHSPEIWNSANLEDEEDDSAPPSRRNAEPESFTSHLELEPTFPPSIVRTHQHYRDSLPSSSEEYYTQGHPRNYAPRPPPPLDGPPPMPTGITVNPQQWQAGFWQINPAWKGARPTDQQQQQPQPQHVPRILSPRWMQKQQKPQQPAARSQQPQQQPANFNPYKRVIKPPSAEHLATKLSDNALGLTDMTPLSTEENYKQDHPRNYVPKPPPPFDGPPPIPTGITVDPQQWQAGFWKINPAWKGARPTDHQQQQQPQPQHVLRILSPRWMQKQQKQQQPAARSQQPQQEPANFNPYKRVIQPPSTTSTSKTTTPSATEPYHPPPQGPTPPSYNYKTRHGYWNRRGDHLTPTGYLVYAPPHLANPFDLRTYPPENEGYMDHNGQYTAWCQRPELPASLPRMGKGLDLPYEKFVVWVYK